MAWNPNERGSYAWFTKEASRHGGVTSYINDIENNAIAIGMKRGIIATVVVMPIVVRSMKSVEKLACDKYKEWKRHRSKVRRKSEEAKRVLINMDNATKDSFCQNDEFDIVKKREKWFRKRVNAFCKWIGNTPVIHKQTQ